MAVRRYVLALTLVAAPCVRAQAPQAYSLPIVTRYHDAGARAIDAELKPLLSRTLARYATLFGGPPKDASGKALDSLIVDVASGPVGGGESDPGIIQLTVGAKPVFG